MLRRHFHMAAINGLVRPALRSQTPLEIASDGGERVECLADRIALFTQINADVIEKWTGTAIGFSFEQFVLRDLYMREDRVDVSREAILDKTVFLMVETRACVEEVIDRKCVSVIYFDMEMKGGSARATSFANGDSGWHKR